MNRKKLIYFLSAFVLIIGCYALNLSYSLFTASVTSESNLVDTFIPTISARLETNTFNIPANSSELIRLNILNEGSSDIQYGVKISEEIQGITVYLVDKTDNDIVGDLEKDSNKEAIIYVVNETAEVKTITLELEAKYQTITFDKESFKKSSNINCINKVKILNEAIMDRATSAETDVNRTVYNATFDSSNITGASGTTERLLVEAEDDYGNSYVFRGAVKDNYVNFAGFTWRIVRINGDGTIRLILEGTLNKVCGEKNTDGTCKALAGSDSAYNSTDTNNRYVGYMYGYNITNSISGDNEKCLFWENNDIIDKISQYNTNTSCVAAGGKWTASSYDATHLNFYSSTIKSVVDGFYEKYIENNSKNIHYEKYLADTLFCNDKSLAEGEEYWDRGFDQQITKYASLMKAYYSIYPDLISTAKPNLKCAVGDTRNYSRFTAGNAAGDGRFDMKTNIGDNISINNDLTYPIALLNADELVIAGAWRNSLNTSYYLYDAKNENLISDSNYWWLLAPAMYNNGAEMFRDTTTGGLRFSYVSNVGGVRPVINLRSDVISISGDGTKEVTYDELGNMLTAGPYIIN